MKIIFLLLSGLFFFKINVLSQNGLFDERDKLYYREIISLYPKFLVSHLPENIDNKVSGAQSLLFPRGKYLNYIHLTLPCGNSKREILKKEMASQAKRIYYLGDSCLTLPYDYENFEIIKSDSIRNLPFVDTLPIPNFSSWEGGVPPDFYKKAVIYLLAAEKGRFLPDDCLSRNGVGLPNEWVHGYTKGLVLYKYYVIYWLEVW